MPAQPSVPTDAYAPDRVGAESPDAMPEWLVSVLAQIILILFKYWLALHPRRARRQPSGKTEPSNPPPDSPAAPADPNRSEIRKLFSQLRRRYGVPPARPDVQDAAGSHGDGPDAAAGAPASQPDDETGASAPGPEDQGSAAPTASRRRDTKARRTPSRSRPDTNVLISDRTRLLARVKPGDRYAPRNDAARHDRARTGASRAPAQSASGHAATGPPRGPPADYDRQQFMRDARGRSTASPAKLIRAT
jgi:hypothetical protein